MNKIIIIFFPFLLFGQEKDEWTISMQKAIENIQNQDYNNAILNLDKSLKIIPKNWSALYFKGYSQLIIVENDNGCRTLIDAIYYGGNNDTKKIYVDKCINFNPKLNLEGFKMGKFTLQILNDSLVYNFERKDNIQFEFSEGRLYKGKIMWFENGDYTIIPDKETEKIMIEKPKFLVRVLKIENNEYLYEKIEAEKVQFGIIKKIQ